MDDTLEIRFVPFLWSEDDQSAPYRTLRVMDFRRTVDIDHRSVKASVRRILEEVDTEKKYWTTFRAARAIQVRKITLGDTNALMKCATVLTRCLCPLYRGFVWFGVGSGGGGFTVPDKRSCPFKKLFTPDVRSFGEGGSWLCGE